MALWLTSENTRITYNGWDSILISQRCNTYLHTFKQNSQPTCAKSNGNFYVASKVYRTNIHIYEVVISNSSTPFIVARTKEKSCIRINGPVKLLAHLSMDSTSISTNFPDDVISRCKYLHILYTHDSTHSNILRKLGESFFQFCDLTCIRFFHGD